MPLSKAKNCNGAHKTTSRKIMSRENVKQFAKEGSRDILLSVKVSEKKLLLSLTNQKE
jgi:predicted transcriptional regulator